MTETQPAGRRVLLVVPVTQFRDEEVFPLKRALEAAGAAVTVGASSVRTCRGMGGGTVEAAVAIPEVPVGEGADSGYDAVVLAGGASVPELLWKDKALVALVSGMAGAGKLVAAISLSTVVLARAGLLGGKRATVYHLPEALDELRSAGATLASEPVVVEGNLITAEGPGSVGAFAEAIVLALAGATAHQTAS